MRMSPRIAAVVLSNIISAVGLTSSEMPISALGTFLGIVIWGGEGTPKWPARTINEIADKLSQPASTIYQHVRYLGTAPHRYGKPGLGLVETRENPADRRQKLVTLTPAGEALMAKIIEGLENRPGASE